MPDRKRRGSTRAGRPLTWPTVRSTPEPKTEGAGGSRSTNPTVKSRAWGFKNSLASAVMVKTRTEDRWPQIIAVGPMIATTYDCALWIRRWFRDAN